jgi:hypothetical protein
LQELWLELTTAEELQAAQKNLSTGKMLVVDYYAGTYTVLAMRHICFPSLLSSITAAAGAGVDRVCLTHTYHTYW